MPDLPSRLRALAEAYGTHPSRRTRGSAERMKTLAARARERPDLARDCRQEIEAELDWLFREWPPEAGSPAALKAITAPPPSARPVPGPSPEEDEEGEPTDWPEVENILVTGILGQPGPDDA